MSAARVVLIGGAAEDGDIWADVLELLDDSARVHTLPGREERAGQPPATIEDMADDVLTALAEPAVLVGHSMGGAVALTAALRGPDLVAGVVAVASGARMPVNPELLAALPEGFDAVLPSVLAYSTGGREAVPPGREGVAERMEAMLRRGGAELFAADLAACAGYDLRAELGALATPLIVLVGDEDLMAPPRLAEELAETAGGVLHVMPGATHQLPWDAPGAVADAVELLAAR